MKTLQQSIDACADRMIAAGYLNPKEVHEMRCEDPTAVLVVAICGARLRHAAALMKGGAK